jgi:hypothetical protein
VVLPLARSVVLRHREEGSMESPALDLLTPPARRHSPRMFRFVAPLTISATIVGWLGFCLLKSAWVAWWRTLGRLWHGLVIAYGVA